MRIKLKPRERQGIPTLTWYWARAYERFEPWLGDPEIKLIQVGMQINHNRSEPRGARGYTVLDISQTVQQRINVHQDTFVRSGTPRLNVPRGPGRPPAG